MSIGRPTLQTISHCSLLLTWRLSNMGNWKPPLSYLQRFLHKPQLDHTVLTLIFRRVEYTQHTCTNTPRPACWCSPHPTWPGSDNQDITFKLTPLNPISPPLGINPIHNSLMTVRFANCTHSSHVTAPVSDAVGSLASS